MDRKTYNDLVRKVGLGKKVGGDLYLHTSAVSMLPWPLRRCVQEHASSELKNGFNVLKFHGRAQRISLLSYPGFMVEAFPALTQSIIVDLPKGERRARKYDQKGNPPILHRKETLLAPDHPDVPRFRELTEAAERSGLFEKPKTIGRRKDWQRLLEEKGYRIEDHALVAIDAGPGLSPEEQNTQVARYRTAIKRHGLSVPVQTLADHGFLDGQYSVFDFGCGRGDDVRVLEANGITAHGWDPNFRPDEPQRSADIVNLGFVLNVIEKPNERRKALRDAFELTTRLLVASVMLAGRSTIEQFAEFGDGVITKRNTFQKYFTQNEFREYLASGLDVQPIAVAPGVFYLFKDALDEQVFLLERQKARRRPTLFIPEDTSDGADEKRRAVLETNKGLLTAYWQRCLELGRQAKPAEFDASIAVRRLFGSYKQAFSFLLSYFGKEKLELARRARADDLLVYFALREFERRTAYKHLPDVLKRDVKEYFGIYRSAKDLAKELLFSCGRPDVIRQACEEANAAGLGYLEDDHSLYLHSSQINELPAVLRVYVGCATQLYGDVERADLVKLHMHSGKVSLMIYDDFDGKPLPLLRERIKIRLREQQIDFFHYDEEFAPQPVYLKSRFLPPDFAHVDEQIAFDRALEESNLFDLSGFGPSLEEFEATLQAKNLKIKGFRLASR